MRRDGRWQEQSREAYDRGNGAVILLYNRHQQSVVLIRQFRFPVWINGHDGFLIEAAAGLLDNASPEERIIAEAEEETGFRVTRIEPVFTAFMSPGSVTEKLYFFIAEYSADDRRGDGGGLAAEGEDIEVLEWPLARAYRPFAMAKSWMRKPLCCYSTWRKCRYAPCRLSGKEQGRLAQFAGNGAVHQRRFQRLCVKGRFRLRPG